MVGTARGCYARRGSHFLLIFTKVFLRGFNRTWSAMPAKATVPSRPHLQKKKVSSLLQSRKGGSGLEAVRDVMSRLETEDRRPRFGLSTEDLQNLRLTSSSFRDALPANARWQWYLSRSPALNLLWLAHTNGVNWVMDHQIWTVVDEGENVLYICKSRMDELSERVLYFRDVMSGSNLETLISDETNTYDTAVDIRRRLRDIEEDVNIPTDTAIHTANEIDSVVDNYHFDLPFYLNIYLPNVPNAIRPQFLEVVRQLATSSAMNAQPAVKDAAASYRKMTTLTETFEENAGGARSSSKSSSKSKSSSSGNTGRSGYSSNNTSASASTSNGSNGSSMQSDHSVALQIPFYLNVYFKAKPSMTKKLVRVMDGCPSIAQL